jgi:hypothetical protein
MVPPDLSNNPKRVLFSPSSHTHKTESVYLPREQKDGMKFAVDHGRRPCNYPSSRRIDGYLLGLRRHLWPTMCDLRTPQNEKRKGKQIILHIGQGVLPAPPNIALVDFDRELLPRDPFQFHCRRRSWE